MYRPLEQIAADERDADDEARTLYPCNGQRIPS